jgi:hypothetical protein
MCYTITNGFYLDECKQGLLAINLRLGDETVESKPELHDLLLQIEEDDIEVGFLMLLLMSTLIWNGS